MFIGTKKVIILNIRRLKSSVSACSKFSNNIALSAIARTIRMKIRRLRLKRQPSSKPIMNTLYGYILVIRGHKVFKDSVLRNIIEAANTKLPGMKNLKIDFKNTQVSLVY